MGQNPKNGFMAVDFPAYGHFMWFDPSPYDFGVGHLRLPVFGCWNGGFPTSGAPKTSRPIASTAWIISLCNINIRRIDDSMTVFPGIYLPSATQMIPEV